MHVPREITSAYRECRALFVHAWHVCQGVHTRRVVSMLLKMRHVCNERFQVVVEYEYWKEILYMTELVAICTLVVTWFPRECNLLIITS